MSKLLNSLKTPKNLRGVEIDEGLKYKISLKKSKVLKL
jgi:hypothetical protein